MRKEQKAGLNFWTVNPSVIHEAAELFIWIKNISWHLNLFFGTYQIEGAVRGCDMSSRTEGTAINIFNNLAKILSLWDTEMPVLSIKN